MLKFALVGCGRIAQRYAEIFSRNLINNSKIECVSDVVRSKAKALGDKLSVPFFLSYHEMLEKHKSVNVVIILTESGNHANHVIDIAQYKKHIIVEKPMALTLFDADRMIDACNLCGIKLFVVKQNRFNLPVQKLRETFNNGSFGKIVSGSVRVRWSRDQNYYDESPWRGTWGMDGGVFTNQASHHIDLLTWFLGTPVSIYAKSRTALVDIECEDTGAAIITFSSGAIGIIEATTAVRPIDIEGSFSLLGEKGMVEIGGFAVNKLSHWNFSDQLLNNIDKTEFSENPPNVYGFGHIRYLNEVVRSIKNGKEKFIDGVEGRKTLEIINGIYESIERGKEMPLKFNKKFNKLGSKN